MNEQQARDEVRDAVAKAMCAIETRSKAASLEEVQAGIQRWMRHRHEAERLIEELSDYGVEVRKRPESEWEYGTALRASSGNLWDFEVDSKQHAYAHVAECDAADHTPGESCVVVRRLVTYGPWEQVNP